MQHRLSAVAGITVAAMLAFATAAQAQGLTGYARLGGDFGGDAVIQFQYSDGSTPDIEAGRGLLVAAGGALRLFSAASQGLEVVASVGLKFTTIPPATNQDATWLRFPVEGLLVYRTPFGLQIGGGMTVHLANVLKASGGVANERVEFTNKPGFILHAGYGKARWAVDLRYTALEYEVSSGGSGTVNANSVGGGVSILFGGAK
jgi:hypothetical protein